MSSVVLKSNNLNSVNNNFNTTKRTTNSYYLHANASSRVKETVNASNPLSYRQANAHRPVEMRIANNENRIPRESNTVGGNTQRRTNVTANQYAVRQPKTMNISNRRSNNNETNRDATRFQTPTSSRAVDANAYAAMNTVNQYVPTIDQVIPRLYISDDIAARNRRMLDEKNITHILNLTTNIPNKFEPEITYKKLIIFDMENQNIDQYFDEAFEFIDNALKNEKNAVLVHCNAGISRSSSFIIAYLMLKQLYPKYKDALNHVRERRPIVNPNKGFEKQLLFLENRVKKKSVCTIM